MIIKRLTASYGKLGGESLELNGGLNIICAPNESGKSTWCAFIRSMLYGVESSERAKAGHLPDKLRYAPWSGAAMEGCMDVEHDGKEITLTRTTRLKSAPMREFSAVYTGTNVDVEGLTGQNVGEKLTGTTKEVFRRSAFIGQGAVAVNGDSELEKRIASIVSTGEENCSYSEADAALRAWLRKRRFNKYGMLPELEGEISKKKRLINELESTVNEKEALEKSLEKTHAECKRLETEVTESRRQARKDALAKLRAAREDCEAAQRKYDGAAEIFHNSEAELRGSLFGLKEPEAVCAEAVKDRENALAAKAVSERKNSMIPAALCLILGAVLSLVGVFVSYYAYFAAALPLALSCILFSKYSKTAGEISSAVQQRQTILFKYSADDEAGIDDCLTRHGELYTAYREAETELKNAENELDRSKKRQAQTENAAMSELDFAGGSSEAVYLSQKLAAAQAEERRIGRALSELKGREAVMGDRLVIASELMTAEAEYADIQKEYEAISLAADTLKAADADIQSRFSPELGRTAAKYMSLITGGKYAGVYVNRDFSVKTVRDGDSAARETEYLSAGTLDLMYLCLRLAICKLALPEKVPIILDDTLVNFDEERTKQALTLLREIAKERQVIIFTCKIVEE